MNSIWKRSLSLLLAVVMVVGMVPMSVFATEEEACAHENVEYINEPADCIWEGYYAEYCNDCGEYLCEEFIPAAGHSWEENVCTACGETLAVEEEKTEQEDEPEEEAAEEVVEEETAEEIIFEDAPVTFASVNSNADGIIFLDKDRQAALERKLIKGGLREMVLTAIGEPDSEENVYYKDKNGVKRNVANLMDLYALEDELADQLTGSTTLNFIVGNDRIVSIELLNIKNVIVEIRMRSGSTVEAPYTEVPKDLTASVQELLDDAEINVYYVDRSRTINWWDLPAEQYTLVNENTKDYIWPGKTESVKTNTVVSLSIKDSVDGKTTASDSVNIKLVDSTDVRTVKFESSEGVTYKSYPVIDGEVFTETAKTVGTPVRAYYTFAGWDREIENVEITTDVTYVAKWNPTKDSNTNGVADQEEHFSIVYMVEGNVHKSFNQLYGTKTKLPEEEPKKDGATFLSWVPAEDQENGLVDESVTRNMTYVAKWLESEEFAVVYTLDRIGNTPLIWKNKTVDGKAIYQHVEGVFSDWKHQGELFDFDQIITEDMTEDGTLYLEASVGVDLNEDGYADGSEKDPIVTYIFSWGSVFDAESGEYVWSETPFENRVYHKNDEHTKVDIDALDLKEYWAPVSIHDNKAHIGWTPATSVKAIDNNNWENSIHVPEYANDFNNNEIRDELEKATLNIIGNGTVKVTTLDINAGSEVGEGTVKSSVLEENGEFLYNAANVDNATNNVDTVIAVVPDTENYVSEIRVNGTNVLDEEKHYDEAQGAYVINLTELGLEPVKANSEDGEFGTAYYVEVEIVETEIEFKSNEDVSKVLKAGQTYTTEDVEKLYDAVVNTPARREGDTVTVQYVAREAGNVTVNTKLLRDRVAQKYGKLGEKLLDKAGIPETIELPLVRVPKDVDYQPTGMVKTAQQVFDNFIMKQDIGIAVVTEILGGIKNLEDLKDANELKEYLKNELFSLIDMEALYTALDSEANIRPFLYNESGKSFEETILVTYEGNGPVLPGECTFVLKDERSVEPFELTDKAYTYKTFSDDNLLPDDIPNVTLDNTYKDRDAMTYTVTAYRAGDENTQPARTTFKLEIKKAAASVKVDSVIVEKHDDIYNAAPVVTPEDADVIGVVAGLDLNELDLDVALHGDPNAYLKNVKAKAWISLPESLKNDLEDLGTDLSKTYKVSEIKGLIEDADELMEAYGVDRAEVDKIISVLEKVEDFRGYNIYNYADAELTMDVVFRDDVYPTNPGVYVNLAVTADPNYTTAYDYGTILIAPVVALPNRGGVQLTLNDLAENLFIEPSDGKAKELTVTYNGSPVKADVFYYGMDAELKIHSGTTAPTLPGVYMASTIYTVEENGSIRKLGSDTAVIVIGMTEITLDVESKIVEFAENGYFKPEVTVTDKHGNIVDDAAVTMISGTVGVDNDEDLGLDDVTANLNISFPETVHKYWREFAEYVNTQNKVDVIWLDPDMENAVIKVETFVEFVNWCDGKLNAALNAVNDRLGYLDKLNRYLDRINDDQDYVDQVKNGYKRIMEELKAVSKKLVEAAEKVEKKTPDKLLTITFKKWDDMKFHDKGVYFFYGIVTDPDYIPASNAGVLVIKDQDDALVLLDTHTPYDGTGKKPFGWDNTKRDGFTMILDKNSDAYGINFLVDDHMTEVLTEFKNETGIDLFKADGYEVSEIYVKGVEKAEELVAKICGGIEEKVISKIQTETGKEIAEASKTLLNKYLGELKTKLLGKLNELKESDAVITVNGALPVDVGTYEFYAYSYSIEVAYAELVIEPIYVRITAPTLSKEYDGEGTKTIDPNKLNPEVSYYSYEYHEGESRKTKEMSRPAGLVVTPGTIDCRDEKAVPDDWAVDNYEINVVGAKINDVKYAKLLAEDIIPGNLTITPRKVTVKAIDATKYYGEADPDFNYETIARKDGEPSIIDGDTLNLTVCRVEQGEDVSAEGYELKVDDAGNNPNYEVETVVGGKLTIMPAEITITIGNYDKCFEDEDLEDYKDVTDPVTTIIVDHGLSADNLQKLIGKTKDDVITALNVKIKRGEEISGNGDDKDDVGETFKLIAEYDPNANVKVTVTSTNKIVEGENEEKLYAEYGILTIGYGDYVCWNMQTGVYYDDLSDALLDVDGAEVETIQMLKDFTETDYIIIAPGTTLDLDVYTVTAENFVVGFDGSYLDGNVFDIDGAYGKLITRKSFAMLTDGAFVDEAGYTILPIYYDDGNEEDDVEPGYVFSRMEVNTDQSKEPNRGLVVDEVNNVIKFQFVTNMTGDVRKNILNDGAIGNNVSIVVRLEWESTKTDGEGIAYQDFVYNDGQIAAICGGGKDFTLTLEGYSALYIDLSTLVVKGIVKADCGTVEYGVEWTAPVLETN